MLNDPGPSLGYDVRMGVVKTAHSAYWLQYHVVWVRKYRRRILNPGVCSYLGKLFPKLLRSCPGSRSRRLVLIRIMSTW